MDERILSLSKEGDIEKLTQTLNEINIKKLGNLVTTRCNESDDDFSSLLSAIFQGSPCSCEDGLQRRRFLFNHCMEILNQGDISSKLSTEIVGTLLLEFDATSSKLLCELTEKILESVRSDSMNNGRIFQLFPKILSSIASRESIPLPDGDGELSGPQYKSQMINTLGSIKWDSSCVIHLANMFREVPLTNEELMFVIEKILRMFKSLELEEIPPVVYQLLILCSKGHRISVLEGIITYFNKLDADCSQDEHQDSDELQGIPKDQLRHTEGNVILHITFAIKQDQELGKEFVKYMKVCQQRPHKILTAFNLALALAVAQIHRFEEPIFDVLKAAVLKSFKGVELRNISKWMQDNVESIPDISKEILKTVQNSMFGWDHVTQGIVQLGFILMDAFGSRNNDTMNVGHSTPQQEASQLGSQILLNAFKAHDIIRTEILEQIFNRLLTKTTNSSKHYIDLLRSAVSTNPQALLDSLSKVKEVFEYMSCLPLLTAQGLFQAVLPLMRISITLRDSLMLVLRKAMFSRNIEARKIAVSGFLLVLKHFKVHGGNITSSHSLSQSSQSSSQSSSQIQVDVHRGSGTGNEALCLEILGGLRRCFTQQADIRVLLYEGLCDVLCANSELQQPALEIIHKHFLKYYELDQEIIPPVKLDPCLAAAGDQIYLAEPLSHLLGLLQQCVLRGLKVSEQEETVEEGLDELKQFIESLEEIFTSLTKRMNKCELEDFELDKSADYSLNNGVGVKNNIFACLVLGIVEVLMEHSFVTGEYSQENCDSVLQLFNKYWKLSNVLKEKTSTQGKKTRQSSSKQFARSMISLSTTASLLKSILSDSLPSHQQSLEILRGSADFVQYVLNVTLQKLNQINETGFCDGPQGKDLDHIYHKCTVIGRVLLKQINGESCLTEKKDKVNNQSLHGLCLLINIICNRYHTKICTFLAAIDHHHETEANPAIADDSELIHQHIKRFQRLAVTIMSSSNEGMTLKDVPSIVNMISLLSGCFKPDLNRLTQVQSWVERICAEQNIDDVPVTKSLISLLLSLTTQCSSSFPVEKEMATDIHKQLGDIDEDIEIEDETCFDIINPRTAAPTVLLALLNQLEKILDEVEWTMTKIKAELSASLFGSREDEKVVGSPQSSQRDTLENAVCERMICIVQTFHELVQSAIPVGPSSQALLKILTKFYSTLGLMAKYYLFLYAQKSGHVTPSFEKMVRCSGTQLSQQVYAFLTYVQTAEQESRNVKNKGKEKKNSSGTGNLTKFRVMKEMKSIPNLIYAVEQYERYLIQLTKKSKINLMEHFKRSTSRDFRINGATLEAALREESSDDENGLKEDVSIEQDEPPRKKGKP